MKYSFYLKFVLFLLCVFAADTYGQRKEITRDEFSAIYNKAARETNKFSRRLTSKGTVYTNNDGKIHTKTNEIQEYESPERMRLFFKSLDLDSDKTVTSELIIYDGIEYQRNNGGFWTKQATVKAKINYEAAPERSADFFITENLRTNNKKSILLEKDLEVVFRNKDHTNNTISEHTQFQKFKYWISENYLILKFEITTKDVGANTNTTRNIWNVEYDSKIKIKIPAVGKTRKNCRPKTC